MSPANDSSLRSKRDRGLSTARCVLRVLTLLAERPDGVRAVEVAQSVGKSVSTAYNLLESLCEEGFAVRQPRGGVFRLRRDPYGSERPASESNRLGAAVDELHLRTRKRSYLACVSNGGMEILLVRGRQGMPMMPGLGTRITDALHAVAMGKVVLSLLPDHARQRYAQRGLKAFTAATITAPGQLLAELVDVRRQGYAVEREEFTSDFSSVAAPILDDGGRFAATVGVSASTRAFDAEHEHLVAVVRDVASRHVPKRRNFLNGTTAPRTTVGTAIRETHHRSGRESSKHHEISSEDPGTLLGADVREPG